MNVFTTDTQENHSLSITSPAHGFDYTYDFIGNHLTTDWDEDRDAMTMTQETFDWWNNVINQHQALENRIHALSIRLGQSAVYIAIGNEGNCDLEDQPHYINRALDEAFGS